MTEVWSQELQAVLRVRAYSHKRISSVRRSVVMVPQNASLIIDMLDKASKRPGAYVGVPSAIDQFLAGVHCTSYLFGLERDRAVYEKVVRERGWNLPGVSWRMLKNESEMNDLEIATEILSIEKETWKRTYGLSV